MILGHLLADGGGGDGEGARAAPAQVFPLALLGKELQLTALGGVQSVAVLGLGEKGGKMAANGVSVAQNGRKWGQCGPKWHQNGPKWGQCGPKWKKMGSK